MQSFSQEEQSRYYNSLPKKLIGSMAWVKDEEGRLLICKPAYKSGWSLVGGTVDLNESPTDAVVRELQEETGLRLPLSRFTFFGFRYIAPHNGRDDHVQLYFKVHLTKQETSEIKVVNPQEIIEHRFVALADLSEYADTPRMLAVAAAAEVKTPTFYMVDETIIGQAS